MWLHHWYIAPNNNCLWNDFCCQTVWNVGQNDSYVDNCMGARYTEGSERCWWCHLLGDYRLNVLRLRSRPKNRYWWNCIWN